MQIGYPFKTEEEKTAFEARMNRDDIEFVKAAIEKGDMPEYLISDIFIHATKTKLQQVMKYTSQFVNQDTLLSAIIVLLDRSYYDPSFRFLSDKHDCEYRDSKALQIIMLKEGLLQYPKQTEQLIIKSNSQAAIAKLLFSGYDEAAQSLSEHVSRMVQEGRKTLSKRETIIKHILDGNTSAVAADLDREDMAFGELLPLRCTIMLKKTNIAEAIAQTTQPNLECIGISLLTENQPLFETLFPLCDTKTPAKVFEPINEACIRRNREALITLVQHLDYQDVLDEMRRNLSSSTPFLESVIQETLLRQKTNGMGMPKKTQREGL